MIWKTFFMAKIAITLIVNIKKKVIVVGLVAPVPSMRRNAPPHAHTLSRVLIKKRTQPFLIMVCPPMKITLTFNLSRKSVIAKEFAGDMQN